jgi:hypothetical protein
MFHCIDVEGQSYLASDTSILCSSEHYQSFVPLGVIGILLFPVCIPLLFLVLLFRHRHSRADPATAEWLGFLYAAWSSNVPYFELLDLANK